MLLIKIVLEIKNNLKLIVLPNKPPMNTTQITYIPNCYSYKLLGYITVQYSTYYAYRNRSY